MGGFVGNVFGAVGLRSVFDDVTGKTATEAGEYQANAITHAADKAAETQRMQYNNSMQQSLPFQAAYESMVMGVPPSQTQSGQILMQMLKSQNTSPPTQLQSVGNKIGNEGMISQNSGIFNQGLLGALEQGQGQASNQALQNLPGYNFTMQSGLNALQNSASGRGLQTGAQQKAIIDYGNNVANNFLMQQLGGYGGVQQNAANTMNYGNNLANLQYGSGSAAGSAYAGGLIARMNNTNSLIQGGIGAVAGGMGGMAGGMGGMGGGMGGMAGGMA